MSSIVNEAKGVASTFTSWDSCMSKTYCKYDARYPFAMSKLLMTRQMAGNRCYNRGRTHRIQHSLVPLFLSVLWYHPM